VEDSGSEPLPRLHRGLLGVHYPYGNWVRQEATLRHVPIPRIDLSGCPKLESIPEDAFGGCRHLVKVVFGKHSSITNIGECGFECCSALTSITLPNKLKNLDAAVFSCCSSLKRVVCNKSLKTIGRAAF